LGWGKSARLHCRCGNPKDCVPLR